MIPERIVNAVAENYNVSVNQMVGRRRPEHIVFPRQVAMYLCRTILGATFDQVGEWFGRDHGTVLHACRRIESLTGSQRQEVMRLASRLGMPSLEFANITGRTVLVRERGALSGPVDEAVVIRVSEAGDYVSLWLKGEPRSKWFPVRHFCIVDLVDNLSAT